jgi:hypothetical protein
MRGIALVYIRKAVEDGISHQECGKYHANIINGVNLRTMPSPNGVKLHQPRQFTRPSPVTVALNAENSTKSIRISSWSLRFTTIPKKSNHVNQSSAAVPRQLIWSQTNLSADLQHCLCYTMAPHPCYCDLHIGIVARCL